MSALSCPNEPLADAALAHPAEGAHHRAGRPEFPRSQGPALSPGGSSPSPASVSMPARLLIAPVRWYQRYVSPALPPSCRYYPSCSEYAVQAVRNHGAAKGLLLAAWRLMRCNPWTPGGVDHVPEPGNWSYHHPHDIARPHGHESSSPTV